MSDLNEFFEYNKKVAQRMIDVMELDFQLHESLVKKLAQRDEMIMRLKKRIEALEGVEEKKAKLSTPLTLDEG
tara:strand:- start:829 stop:1047 length:219 start_codon:yes stop_codon:yes gene_type:complete